jgi:hypothetical protein
MTNQIAISLGGLILLGIGFDAVWHDGVNLLFLARKFTGLVEWLAFWR